MSSSLLDHSLGSIACDIPGASRVFHQHRLDFCCNGGKSLRDAAAQKGIDAEAIAIELQTLTDCPGLGRDWREASSSELIDHLDAMQQELESHMLKEEQILFPMLRQDMHAGVSGPISIMRFEHDHHGEALETINKFTNDITPPGNACNTWRALYRGLSELREDLMQHIHLENNVLFARIQAEGEKVHG